MLNTETTEMARAIGRKAGFASHHGDAAGVSFQREYFRRLVSLEDSSVRRTLETAYDEGYREETQGTRMLSGRGL